jgi:acyl carrier protein
VSDLDTRLTAIFRVAFPSLDELAIPSATRDSVAAWDSIAAVTLARLVEEEFGPVFDPDRAADWASYADVRRALAERLDA